MVQLLFDSALKTEKEDQHRMEEGPAPVKAIHFVDYNSMTLNTALISEAVMADHPRVSWGKAVTCRLSASWL